MEAPSDFTFLEKQLPKILLGAILPDVRHLHLNPLTNSLIMGNSGMDKMTTIISRNITTLVIRRILRAMTLNSTGSMVLNPTVTIKNNLSPIWRFLAPHLERVFLNLNQAGAF